MNDDIEKITNNLRLKIEKILTETRQPIPVAVLAKETGYSAADIEDYVNQMGNLKPRVAFALVHEDGVAFIRIRIPPQKVVFRKPE